MDSNGNPSDRVHRGIGDSHLRVVWTNAGEGVDNVYRSFIGAAYFKTLGTPLLAGREFDDRERASRRVSMPQTQSVRATIS
jgi:hypothetical protein